MPPKPTSYQKRIKVLRAEAERGSRQAVEELHKRYHINQIMINGQLVDLKDRLAESSRRL